MEDSPEATLERHRVSAARTGDETAFGELMQANYESVFRTVLAIVRNEHDARDLCQEIWIKAWQQIGKFRGDSKFTTWVHPIAVRRAVGRFVTWELPRVPLRIRLGSADVEGLTDDEGYFELIIEAGRGPDDGP